MYFARFPGCYLCKVRRSGCSLSPQVDGKGLTKKSLCWWIGFIHHVSAILDLDTEHGPISVLPSYSDVEFIEVPDFAKRVISQARVPKTQLSVEARWEELQELTQNQEEWPFYGVPHQKLLLLDTSRPVASLWPQLGVRADVLTRGLKNLRDGQAGHLTRLFASGVEDGFQWKRRGRGASSIPNQGTAKKGPGHKKAKGSLTSAPSHTDSDEGMCLR